jgi:putative phosphoribosyl transferase
VVNDAAIVDAGRRLAAAACSSARVVLFGSRARGDAREDSDLDFLVIEERLDSKLSEMVRLREALTARTGAVDSAAGDPPDPPAGDRRFKDRRDAGRRLARLLEGLRSERPLVVAIPRGGVPVAAEVATALGAPLDVVVVRKIGAPSNPEYGIGALAEGGVGVIAEEAVRALGIPPDELQRLVARAERELAERIARYRGPAPLPAHPPLPVAGRTAIVVDDGLATGRTAQVAVRSLRARGAKRVILAVPVAAPSSVADLQEDVDEVVCVETPANLWAVGFWYEDFAATSDREVTDLLDAAAARARR